MLEQLPDGGADSRASSRARSVGSASATGSAWTHRAAVGADDAGAHDGPGARPARRARARRRAACPRFSMRAMVPDAGVAAVVDPGHEQDPVVGRRRRPRRGLGLVGLEGEGHDHLGEHDAGGQRQDGEGEGCQVSAVELSRVQAFGHARLLGDYQIASKEP